MVIFPSKNSMQLAHSTPYGFYPPPILKTLIFSKYVIIQHEDFLNLLWIENDRKEEIFCLVYFTDRYSHRVPEISLLVLNAKQNVLNKYLVYSFHFIKNNAVWLKCKQVNIKKDLSVITSQLYLFQNAL